MYGASARYYDAIYSRLKDYRKEVADLMEVIRAHGGARGGRLLDVACGTGEHLRYFREHFAVEGLDLSPELVEIARTKNPGVPVHVGDMRDFSLGRAFDVVTCLFSSIGYMTSTGDLHAAVDTMSRHVSPGGLLIVEPWFRPDQWNVGHIALSVVDEEELKIVRMSTSKMEGAVSTFDLHFLIGEPQGTSHFVESHRMGLFTRDEMQDSFSGSQMRCEYDPQGPFGRGLYIGIRS